MKSALMIAIGLVIVALALLLCGAATGCAEHAKCHNYQPGIKSKVYLNPANCHDEPDGMYRCNGVLFDPQEVKAK